MSDAAQLSTIADLEKALADIAEDAGLPAKDWELAELAAHIWRCGERYAEVRSAIPVASDPIEQLEGREPRAMPELANKIERLEGLLERIGVVEALRGRPRSDERKRVEDAASFRLTIYGEPATQAELVTDLLD